MTVYVPYYLHLRQFHNNVNVRVALRISCGVHKKIMFSLVHVR